MPSLEKNRSNGYREEDDSSKKKHDQEYTRKVRIATDVSSTVMREVGSK